MNENFEIDQDNEKQLWVLFYQRIISYQNQSKEISGVLFAYGTVFCGG